MRKLTITRPSPAFVIAIVALFAAMGGTGYAAATITGKSIKNNTITTSDIKSNTVRGSDVRTNTRTGSDISESKLGKVPSSGKADSATAAATAGSAANADNSGKLEGRSLRGIQQWVLVGSDGSVEKSSGGVTVVKLGANGRYRVSFASDVRECGLNANAGSTALGTDASNYAARFVNLAHSSTGVNDVQVEVQHHDGVPANNPFYLTAQC